MTLTDEWIECFQEAKDADQLRTPFFRLAVLIGLPMGVDEDDERVRAALRDIAKANGAADVEGE